MSVNITWTSPSLNENIHPLGLLLSIVGCLIAIGFLEWLKKRAKNITKKKKIKEWNDFLEELKKQTRMRGL